jgi:hypothetical protein
MPGGDFPFTEKQLDKNIITRCFKTNVLDSELIWHRDKENRLVEIIEPGGWWFQMDNEIPIKLYKNQIIAIHAEVWHRVIRGNNDLVIKITKF